MTTAGDSRGPVEQRKKEAASPPLISWRAAHATGPLLRPQGRFAFPAEMAFGHP